MRRLLGEIELGDRVSIILNNGMDVSGRVLNLFYPVGDPIAQSSRVYDKSGRPVRAERNPFGIKVDEAQAEEVVSYQNIRSYIVL